MIWQCCATVTYANDGLIRLKKFVSWSTDVLCNLFFYQYPNTPCNILPTYLLNFSHWIKHPLVMQLEWQFASDSEDKRWCTMMRNTSFFFGTDWRTFHRPKLNTFRIWDRWLRRWLNSWQLINMRCILGHVTTKNMCVHDTAWYHIIRCLTCGNWLSLTSH